MIILLFSLGSSPGRITIDKPLLLAFKPSSIPTPARMRSQPPSLALFSLLVCAILVLLHNSLRAQVGTNCATEFSRLQVMRADLLLFDLSLLGLVQTGAPCFGAGNFFLSFAFQSLFEEFGIDFLKNLVDGLP